MKLLLLLALLPPFSATAHALDEIAPPKQPLWVKLLNQRYEVVGREQAIKMAVLLPKIYGFRFVCQFKSAAAGAVPTAVLPGEELNATEGGTLHCPEHYDLLLEKNAKLRLQQVEQIPRFIITQGKITLTFGPDPLFLESSLFSAALQGEGKEQVLLLNEDPKLHSLICDRGVIALDYEAKTPGEKQFLTSRDCRLVLAVNGSPVMRYVSAADNVDANNLVLPRHFWPQETGGLTGAQGGPGTLRGLEITSAPSPTPGGPLDINWLAHRSAPLFIPDITCHVYGQKTDAEAMTEISKFSSSQLNGNFSVGPEYRNGYVSMVCESDTMTLSSNVLDLQTQAAMTAGFLPPPPGEPSK